MSSGPDLLGHTIDRRFCVERKLGSGGMGTVWLVQHVESLQRYALKVLAPNFANEPDVVARLLREARAAAALRTRHVVRVVDAHMGYVHAGIPTPFLVMELLEGGTLDSVVALRRGLTLGEAVWALGQVARALAAAHEQGIVHRDLKPTHVFVATDEDGAPIVKLCEFGIARLLPGSSRQMLAGGEKSTQKELMLGSPMYMAPEQLSDARQVVPATDQWAFGLLVPQRRPDRSICPRVALARTSGLDRGAPRQVPRLQCVGRDARQARRHGCLVRPGGCPDGRDRSRVRLASASQRRSRCFGR